MKRLNIEMAVGLFLIVGLICFSYLAIKLGDVGLFDDETYAVKASFISVSGLKEGAAVELAGVKIGNVSAIHLNPEEYEAEVKLAIDEGVRLQEDIIASIRTQGIIGDKFIKITPGGAEEYLSDGMEIEDTESAISLEELISKYIFESDSEK
jgi:phospholipid/cholesterol/gamma-HCH transport system substrate-binding protein